MNIILTVVVGVAVVGAILVAFLEYRIRQPDFLVLHESKGRISLRKGLIYPRHFSLPIQRTTYPIQLTIEATAAGNLGVCVKLVGSVAPSLEHIQSLIRVGGWNRDAVTRATDEVQVLLQGLVKEYTERSGINTLSSANILSYLNERSAMIKEKFGVELISLAIQSLEPTDPEIADALRQQEQARLLEQTEHLSQQARVAAAKAKSQADEEIAEMEHALDLKKVELKKLLLEKESALTHQSLSDELTRNRMRLAFEIEELEVLKNSPELLMLTPQAARLAEASQNLKNARTVISLTPQGSTHGSELLNLFQDLLQKALEAKKDAS
jgi:predicted ATP-dependent endonuclease of OLD family